MSTPFNPLQKLAPARLSHRELVRSGWAGFYRADIINAMNPDSGISGAIVASQTEILGHEARWSHTMRYVGMDKVLDQQDSLQLRTLENYIGHFIRVYHNPVYSKAQRNALVAEAQVWHGTEYDLRLIGAHLAEMIVGVDGLAERLHDPDRWDCSEGVCVTQRYVDPGFMGKRECQVMPQEIDDWCIEQGWWVSTYLLEE